MTPIDPAGFEALYRADPDPWRTWSSPFEAHKRRMLLAACGPGKHGRVLDLACGSGATTAALADRALRLHAVDSSASALAVARERCAARSNITFIQGDLPEAMPRGPYDLIVMSELAYYLRPRALDRLCRGIERAMAPGGRMVLLHHHVRFPDAAQMPAAVHSRIMLRLAGSVVRRHTHRDRLWRCEAVARIA